MFRSFTIPVMLFAFACNDRTKDLDNCYEQNPDPGAMEGPYDLVCGAPFDYLPETPAEVEGEGPYHVAFCEPADSASSCSMCPVDDVNGRIEAHLLEVMREMGDLCDPPRVTHISPACVTTPDQGSNTDCCFNAYYWGSCNIKG